MKLSTKMETVMGAPETIVALMAERDAVDARTELAFDCLPDAGFKETMYLYDYALRLIAESTALRAQIRELLYS